MIPTLLFALFQAAPIRIACIGDSITAGVGTSHAPTKSYPAKLQEMLGDRYEVGNFGHSAATLSRKGWLPYWGLDELRLAKQFAPNIVVINLGTNDGDPRNWPASKNSFVPEYKDLIRTFRALPSNPKVFVCLTVPNFEKRQPIIDSAVIPLLKQISREANAPYVDLYSPLAGKVELFPDQLHPNDEGARIMAEIVAEAIEDPAARKQKWKLMSADSVEDDEGPASAAIDGDTYTHWHTRYSGGAPKHPHELVVDMAEMATFTAFKHLPRQDGGVNGRVRGFELYISKTNGSWGEPVLKGEMPNVSIWTTLPFKQPVEGRFFRFVALSEWNGGPWTSVAELDLRRKLP